MTPEDFADEFVNDFFEELNKKISDEGYGFNKTVLNEDPELKNIKSKLAKFGFVLEKRNDDFYKIYFSKELALKDKN